MNKMNPRCASVLLLELLKGKQQPQAVAYVTSLLRHERWVDESSFGFGLPPGSIIHNKVISVLVQKGILQKQTL
jgi:hypothetical protein